MRLQRGVSACRLFFSLPMAKNKCQTWPLQSERASHTSTWRRNANVVQTHTRATSNMSVYTLELEGGRFYVGYTDDVPRVSLSTSWEEAHIGHERIRR